MQHQEIHYEICTEDEQGFNPRSCSYASLDEAERELAAYRKQWPGENAFIVRITMTRVARKNSPLRLQAV